MNKRVLLVAEDDAIDAMLLERAVRKYSSSFSMVRVTNGNELIDYVSGTGRYADRDKFPAPALILLDLMMPGIDGFGVLRWRQQHTNGIRLPVVVFSSSSLARDIDQAYSLGANSYVVKPSAPEGLEHMIKALSEWWVGFNVTNVPNFV